MAKTKPTQPKPVKHNKEAVLPEGMIAGRNAVFEAIRSGRAIDRLFVQDNAEGSIGKILAEARRRGLTCTKVSRAALDRMTGGVVHQGIAAQAAGRYR